MKCRSADRLIPMAGGQIGRRTQDSWDKPWYLGERGFALLSAPGPEEICPRTPVPRSPHG